MRTFDALLPDLINRSPEEDGVGVVGRQSIAGGERGEVEASSEENLEGTTSC